MAEQSYNSIVPTKVENRRAPARGGHGNHWREGGSRRTNLLKGNITRLRARTIMCTDIDRISELAKEDPQRQFSSIAHLITVEKLEEAFRNVRKDASAGIDGVTYQQYETKVEENIRQLHQRLKEGKYQAQPLRRVYIPKEDGKQRPISIPALEDKLVQKVAVDLLNAIYEQDFLSGSYGFRPGRGQHQALDEVGRVLCTRPMGWVLEIDIRAYFDTIVRPILVEMIERRISDGSVLRLIQKWIKVGAIDNGRLLVSETGTGQGQPISPLLANVYLHHVLDVWFEEVVKPRLKGEAYEIRFADDAISAQGGRGQGAQCPTKAVREVWTDTAPGEDAADGIRAVRGEEREATREETGNLQLPRPNAHLRPQPEGEVHSARKDDRETVP